jgi:ABC-type nickel/cobalt efflux system permease component RcnA
MQRSESAEQKLRGIGIIVATLVVGVFACGGVYTFLFVIGMSGETISGPYTLLIIVGLVMGVGLGLMYGVSHLVSGIALSAEEARLRHQQASPEAAPDDSGVR